MGAVAFDQGQTGAGERCLWLAVLVQAIEDAVGRNVRSLKKWDRELVQRDARAFLFAEARRGDLELVCQAAGGLDVEAVREAARRPARGVWKRVCARSRAPS